MFWWGRLEYESYSIYINQQKELWVKALSVA